jgi:hypothetical protein
LHPHRRTLRGWQSTAASAAEPSGCECPSWAHLHVAFKQRRRTENHTQRRTCRAERAGPRTAWREARLQRSVTRCDHGATQLQRSATRLHATWLLTWRNTRKTKHNVAATCMHRNGRSPPCRDCCSRLGDQKDRGDGRVRCASHTRAEGRAGRQARATGEACSGGSRRACGMRTETSSAPRGVVIPAMHCAACRRHVQPAIRSNHHADDAPGGTEGYSGVLGCWAASMQQAKRLVQKSLRACRVASASVRNRRNAIMRRDKQNGGAVGYNSVRVRPM